MFLEESESKWYLQTKPLKKQTIAMVGVDKGVSYPYLSLVEVAEDDVALIGSICEHTNMGGRVLSYTDKYSAREKSHASQLRAVFTQDAGVEYPQVIQQTFLSVSSEKNYYPLRDVLENSSDSTLQNSRLYYPFGRVVLLTAMRDTMLCACDMLTNVETLLPDDRLHYQNSITQLPSVDPAVFACAESDPVKNATYNPRNNHWSGFNDEESQVLTSNIIFNLSKKDENRDCDVLLFGAADDQILTPEQLLLEKQAYHLTMIPRLYPFALRTVACTYITLGLTRQLDTFLQLKPNLTFSIDYLQRYARKAKRKKMLTMLEDYNLPQIIK